MYRHAPQVNTGGGAGRVGAEEEFRLSEQVHHFFIETKKKQPEHSGLPVSSHHTKQYAGLMHALNPSKRPTHTPQKSASIEATCPNPRWFTETKETAPTLAHAQTILYK